MSKLLEIIKKDKMKSAVIAASCLVFIVGLVMTIANSGITYATDSDACYYCIGEATSSGSAYFWGLSKDQPTCYSSSWTTVEEEQCGHEVTIYYSPNGGEIRESTTDTDGTINKWYESTLNGIPTIKRIGWTGSGGIEYTQKIRNNVTNSSDGLVNYNNENFIYITRYGYTVPSGSEWICLSGCKTENDIFDQTKQYKGSKFCDASSEDCSVFLGVNWQPKRYYVSYSNNGGTGGPSGTTHDFGSTFNLSETVPTRDGYDFLGWGESSTATTATYQPGDEYTLDKEGAVVLYAVWKEASSSETTTYNIVFEANGGDESSVPEPQTKEHGDEDFVLSSKIPTRTGYTFLGWSHIQTAKSPDYTSGGSYTPNANATLHAVWQINTVTVQYSVNEGTITSSTTDENGEKNSWTVNSNGVIQKNGSVYQNIINYGSETGTDGLVNYNNEKYINITRNGYSAISGSEWKCLSGCATSGKTFSQSTKYSASDFCDISKKSCTVTLGVNWQANASDEPEEDTSTEYDVILDSQNATTAGTPTLNGKIDEGIYLDSSYSKKMTTSSNKITIPTKTGYTFGGYYTGENGNGTQMISSEGYITSSFTDSKYSSKVTLYAKWTANIYTVKYEKNATDATGTTASSTHTYGVSKQLTANGFSRSGYTFLGWSTKSSGSVEYADKKSVTNLTNVNNGLVELYAIWKSNTTEDEGTTTQTYTVTYNANGGTGAPNSQPKTHGKELTLSSTKPTKLGYTFLGWGTASSDTTSTYNAGAKYTNNANITLYAVWKANTYNIIYTSMNGDVTGNPETGTYDKVVTIKNPTKKVTIVGNTNKTDATIGENVSTDIKFTGWTSSTINTKTAYYDDSAWTNGSTKVTATAFKNLTATNDGKVTMLANWEEKTVTLPTVTKEGYTCNWNTKSNGKGTDYKSGDKYVITSDSVKTINLYAECTANSKTDEEINNSPGTGDALIVLAWLIGIGAIGYSVYYFRSRKSDI